MNNGFPYILQGDNLVVVIDNNSHTVSRATHIVFDRVLDAIKTQNWDSVRELIEPKKVFVSYGMGNVSIEGDRVFWKNTELHNAIARRLVQMYQEGFSIEPLVKFMDNLMQNPSSRAVRELYGFLEKNRLPITPDGYFLAYKKVRRDYMDCHTGTVSNTVGQVVEMERNQVDDNCNNTCSSGLHFCSVDYLSSFGGERIMILKINPSDVVSIPSDYNNSKGRCCRYEVVGELGEELVRKPEEAFTQPVEEPDHAAW